MTVVELECECRSLTSLLYQWQQQSEIERFNCLWVGCRLITVDLPIIQSKVFLHLPCCLPLDMWITSFPLIKLNAQHLKYYLWRYYIFLTWNGCFWRPTLPLKRIFSGHVIKWYMRNHFIGDAVKEMRLITRKPVTFHLISKRLKDLSISFGGKLNQIYIPF